MSLAENIRNAFRASMPGQTISSTSGLSSVLVEEMSDAEQDRLVKIADAWKAYRGELPQPLAKTKSDPLAKDNILLNFGGLIVDTGVSFLLGKSVQFEVDGIAKSDADTWLVKCWAANKQMTRLHHLATNGGVSGDVFLKIVDQKPFPRLIVWDPSCVEAVWSPDDYEDILQFKLQWHGVDPQTKKPRAYRQLITRDGGGQFWTITDQVSDERQKHWETVGTPAVWKFPWSPIFHCQNLPAPNCYYGLSDLEEHVVTVNNALNFVVSNMARIIRLHAHPKSYGRGFQAKDLSLGPEDMPVLPKDGEIKTLDFVTDLGSSLEFYKRLKEALHAITRVPEIATGKVENVGALAGVALKVIYQSLGQKTDTKQMFYGEMLNEVGQRLLELGGQGEEHTVVTKWPDVLPTDPAQDAQALETDQRMGIVSRDTLAARRGYDYNTEKPKIDAEGAALGDGLLTAFDRGQAA